MYVRFTIITIACRVTLEIVIPWKTIVNLSFASCQQWFSQFGNFQCYSLTYLYYFDSNTTRCLVILAVVTSITLKASGRRIFHQIFLNQSESTNSHGSIFVCSALREHPIILGCWSNGHTTNDKSLQGFVRILARWN